MAEFGQLIITDKGSSLIMKTMKSNEKICFTGLVTSIKRYQEDELKSLSELEDIKQRSDISGIDIESNSTIMIHSVIPNMELTEGYYIKAIGLYADDPDEGEILYGVSVETSEGGCYVPSYNNRTVSSLYFNLSVTVGNSNNAQLEVNPGAVVTIKQLDAAEQRIVDTAYQQSIGYTDKQIVNAMQDNNETQQAALDAYYQQSTGYTDRQIANLINGAPSTLDTLGEIADAMSDNQDVVAALNTAIGTKANQAEMDSMLGTKLDKDGGDSKNVKVTFGSSDTLTPSAWTDVAALKSGETHKSIFGKVSTMFKNIRYIWGVLKAITASGAITEVQIVDALPSDAASHPTTFYWIKG